MRSQIEVAKELAQYHRAQDPETVAVKFFPNGNTIQLVEVSRGISAINEILPFTFPSDPGDRIDYPSTIILVSTDDWQSVEGGQLSLPPGWNLHEAVEL